MPHGTPTNVPPQLLRKPSRLIAGWRCAWRLHSVWAAAALTLVSLTQTEVLPLFKFAIPVHWWPWVSGAFGLAIIVLRVIAQPTALTPTKVAPSEGGAA